MTILLFYVAIFAIAFFIVHQAERFVHHARDFTSLKTVTFGDESAVKANRAASVISVPSRVTNSSMTPISAASLSSLCGIRIG